MESGRDDNGNYIFSTTIWTTDQIATWDESSPVERSAPKLELVVNRGKTPLMD